MRRQLSMFAIAGLATAFLSHSTACAAAPQATGAFAVSIEVRASGDRGPWCPIWRFFGADEPNYAYMKNGRKLLAELGELRPGGVYFRAHNLLNSGDGSPALKWGSTGVYREDEEGEAVYDWTILDRIFDTYIARGVRPYTEIGFMPRDLSVKPEPYRHHWRPGIRYGEIFTGWAYPPKDYARWAELVHRWAKHCVERYGREEVETWYWEVWNEPNIGYWQGTREEFLKLHDHAVDAVRRALPTARVGGADTAGSGGRFTRAFLEHCLRGTNHATGKTGTPLDFVSFHAKGAPTNRDGHVRMGIANQLRTIDEGFRIVASFPELKETPVIIGESDPEGCAACQGPQLAYRNGTMYSSYTAASFARKLDLAAKHGVNFQGALTWAFEFEDQPCFAGFRSLATNGIDKPVLNVFRMFSRMGGRRVPVTSDHELPLDRILRRGVRETPDVAALASRDGNRLCVMAWHYFDDDLPGPPADVEMSLSGLPAELAEARLEHFRIDEEHSNAFSVWKEMGSPREPSAAEYAKLEGAGQLAALGDPETLEVGDGRALIRFSLPRQAVSLLVIDWKKTESAGKEGDAGAPPEGDYRLVWSDEFETDGAPDPRNWDHERGFVRNRELQWYRPENARCEKGLLVIEARRERVENPRHDAGSRDWKRSRQYAEYSSASLRTRGLHQFTYGRFEMRARIDVRAGLWPAFWTLGSARRWPAGGEIDIMEYYRGMLLANAAWAGGRRWRASWDDSRKPIEDFGDPDWAKKFHVWRMDWSEREIRLQVDGQLLNSIDLEKTLNRDGTNPFREPHYLMLNLAVGGQQGGDPATTEFPARFEVDYVRVYQRER